MADLASYAYVLSAALFVLSLKWMSEVKTSRRGNIAGALGMLLAVIATFMAVQVQRYDLVAVAIVAGTVVGVPMALKMSMTAVPQRTAISHAFGSIAAALIGTAEYYNAAPNIDKFTMAVLSAEVILGYLTFTGSIIAFAKLQELISGRPFIYPGRRFISPVVLGGAVLMGIYLVLDPSRPGLFLVMSILALIFGVLLVMAIGGADMPTVIAILNSFAGLSAAGLGFVLNNKLLIVAGSLDGSSGLILAILMCKAMNRSFANVLFGGFGAVQKGSVQQAEKSVKSIDAEEAAMVLAYANSVIIVPGYGLAVAGAQHVVRELVEQLEKRGVNVKYAIHPVAGRMPGHMNVLLAEANVPYTQLYDMEDINPEFERTDVALAIGASDIVNPAARHDTSSPIYGMPILDVDKAHHVIVIKRSLSPGFSGIENELFYKERTMMLFGDAREMVAKLVGEIKQL